MRNVVAILEINRVEFSATSAPNRSRSAEQPQARCLEVVIGLANVAALRERLRRGVKIRPTTLDQDDIYIGFSESSCNGLPATPAPMMQICAESSVLSGRVERLIITDGP